MKPLICFLLAVMLALSAGMTASAATKQHCVCKHHKHYKHYKHHTRHYYSTLYSPGYCETRCCPYSCKTVSYCHPGRYLRCHTEFYYHHGRNTSKVEVCG